MSDYAAARQNMVDCQLSTNQIYSPDVLKAMSTVPRELFLAEGRRHLAYLDEDTLIGEGRYLIEPMVLGRLIQALNPKKDEVLLDIGGGTGYSAALFSEMVQTVIALESHDAFLKYAQKVWLDLDLCNIVDLKGDLEQGSSAHAPYDMILINGSVPHVPENLVEQLKIHTGRLACILRPSPESQGKAVLVLRTGERDYSVTSLFDAAVPYLNAFKEKGDFVF
jgi:protein-L-isoaspartate(D-aspartate) O-methyltransferase